MLFQKKLPVTLILLTLALGCGRDGKIKVGPSTDEMIETVIIGSYTETCQGFIEQQCYLEFNEESQEWDFFYESIQGFDFEPGFIWTLKVSLHEREEGIQDVGRYAYRLVAVIDKEEASVDEMPPRKPNVKNS